MDKNLKEQIRNDKAYVDSLISALKAFPNGIKLTKGYNENIKKLQAALLVLGYKLPKFGSDGYYGAETRNALALFQKKGQVAEDASQIRSTLSSLNYDEKGQEIDNGGPVRDELSSISNVVLKTFKKYKPDVDVVITSGNDLYHHKITKYQSKHTKGLAIDFVLNPPTRENINTFLKVLALVKQKHPQITYLDEYAKRSAYATGGHIHMQVNAPNAEVLTNKNTENLAKNKTKTNNVIGGDIVNGIVNSLQKTLGNVAEHKTKGMKKILLSKGQFLRAIKEQRKEKMLMEMAGKKKQAIKMGDDDNSTVVGWEIATNPEAPEEGSLKLLYTCDFEEFKAQHPNFAQIIQNEIGEGADWRFVSDKCPTTQPSKGSVAARPITGDLGLQPGRIDPIDITNKVTKPLEPEKKESKEIKRQLSKILSEELVDNEVLNKRFKTLQIPNVEISSTNIDRYLGDNTNNLIQFGCHSALLHKNVDTFIDSTVAALSDDEDYNHTSMLTYLARQYNREVEGKEYKRGPYKHWNLGRLGNVKKTGLTPVHKLNRLGFEQGDYGLMTASSFRLKGDKFNNSFSWVLEFQVKFGKIKPNDDEVKMLKLFKDMRINHQIEIPQDFEVPEGRTILQVPEILDSLKEILDMFENQILTLDPQEALERGNLEDYDVDNRLSFANALQESELTKGELMKNILEAINGEPSSASVDDGIEKYDDFITKSDGPEDENKQEIQLHLVKDQNGKFYVMSTDEYNPEIIAKFD